MSINEGDIADARASIVEAAKQMLAGSLSYIEGSRRILRLRSAARVGDDLEQAFDRITAIESETDQFPFGAVRETWNLEALAEMDPEYIPAETWAKSVGESTCAEIVDRMMLITRPF